MILFKRKIYLSIISITCSIFSVSCMHFAEKKRTKEKDHLLDLNVLEQRIRILESDNLLARKTLSQLTADVQSLIEQIATDRRNFEVFKRELRSGIRQDRSSTFLPREERPQERVQESSKMTPFSSDDSLLPDLNTGRITFP